MPAKSKSQQRFMGMVRAYQKGELDDAPESVKKAADSMTKKASKDFAKTKHKGLPEKVKEAHGLGIDMTLDQLKQELEDLEKEHEEAVLAGEDSEFLDELEADVENLHELISQKEIRLQSLNVAETFKSMTFSDYLQIDEGPLDMYRGAKATIGDMHQRGKQISAQQQLAGMITKLAAVVKAAYGVPPGDSMTQHAQQNTQGQQAQGKQATAQQKQAWIQQKQMDIATQPPAAYRTKGGKPVAHKAKDGKTLALVARESLANAQFPLGTKSVMTEGAWDFIKGAGREIGNRVASAANAYAERSTLGKVIGAGVQAHRSGKAAKMQQQMFELAKGLLTNAKTIPNGPQILSALLTKVKANDAVLYTKINELMQKAGADLKPQNMKHAGLSAAIAAKNAPGA